MNSHRLHLRQSVRVRITLAAMVVTAVAVGLAGWLLLRSLEDRQLAQVKDNMRDQVERVSQSILDGATPQEAVEESMDPQNGDQPFGALVEVLDKDGDVVARAPGASTTTMGEPPRGETPPEGEGEANANGLIVGDDGQELSGPIEEISDTVQTDEGTFTVIASAPVGQVAQVKRSVEALRSMLLVGLPLVVILVAVTAWVLVGRALRPVEAIRREVDAITGSTMHRRVPEPPTQDEIGRLARTMNAMLGRLDQAATRQRQFVSDASHELRSPVAAIRMGLEVARHKGDAADWPRVADTALADEARLEALLDDLLLLAAYDENGVDALPTTTVDLAALTHAEAERPRRIAVDVVDRVNGAAGTTAMVAGAAPQLTRVVSNLLDNAARHASSAVQVGIARHDDTVRLTVDDDGPGIPAADRERVFERFTRLDDARTRGTGGSGLGLAVVRSVVHRHHGKVWADASPRSGARLVVELPAAAPPAARSNGTTTSAETRVPLG